MIPKKHKLLIALLLTSCGGSPFAGDGDVPSSAGAAGSSSAGAAGSSSAGAAGSSSAGAAGSSSAGAAGSSSAGSSSAGSAGAAGSSAGAGDEPADCLNGWRGSSCDTCTPAPAEPGVSCAVTLDCYEAEHCGPSGCSPACDYAGGQTDHSVALAHAVYACRCP